MLRTDYPKQLNFDIKRLGINAGGLLIGAVETTSQAVAQVIQYLMQQPEWLAKAKTAAQQENTKEFDGMVWAGAALRADHALFIPYHRKRLHRPPKAPGMKPFFAPALMCCRSRLSASFDERAFESPDEFIPQRNYYNYCHFGFGSHECLGRYVGGVMIPEMVRQVFLRQNIAAKAPIDYKSGPFPEQYNLSWTLQ